MATYSRKEVKIEQVYRDSTGFPELDWIYGCTANKWGIPMGTISLWAGESGTGKSRTAIAVCNKMASIGRTILYFQAESDLGTMASKIHYDSFRLSDSKHLEDIITDIKSDKPHIVVIDSINMIKEFKSGTASIIEMIIDSLRDICKSLGTHIILLGQLNQDGSIKGSTALPHLVDIALDIKKDKSGCFIIAVGMKHRYGRTGENFNTGWMHEDHGVVCFTENRKKDERWKEGKDLNWDTVIVPKKKTFSFFRRK